MGNTNTLSNEQQVPINFKQTKRQQHSILGIIRHLDNIRDDKSYILIQRTFASEIQFQRSLQKIKNRIKLAKLQRKYLPNSFIVQILQVRTSQYNQLCGKTFKIFLFIKQFTTDLKKTFFERKSKQHFFQETQILEILLQIVNCLIQLYDHNIKPFHLTMQSIVLRNNICKIIDCQISNQMSPIETFNYKSQLRKGTYLAPQILQNNQNCPQNLSKSDIFTLGIIMLQLATLSFLDQAYDYFSKKINFKMIQSKINSLKYSQNFKKILKQMLQEDPSIRLGLLRLKQNIKKCNFYLLESSKKQNLQSSQYKPNQKNQKFIYLGKQPYPNHQISSLLNQQNPSNHERRNSFHHLFNNKAQQQRNRKSISSHSQLTFNNFNLAKQQKEFSVQNNSQSLFADNYYSIPRQSPLINLNLNTYSYRPQTEKFHQSMTHDVSDNKSSKSDKPVSPITYQKTSDLTRQKQSFGYIVKESTYPKQVFIPKKDQLDRPYDVLDIDKQSKKVDYQKNHFMLQTHTKLSKYKKYFDGKNLPISPNALPRQAVSQQVSPKDLQAKVAAEQQTFEAWMQRQMKKFQSSNQVKIERKNAYNPIIQTTSVYVHQLQTPRINKPGNGNNSKTNSLKKNIQGPIPQQTPIKSLQLMQTQRRQKKNADTSKKQNQLISGRYDFSNGALYQGQFNNDNQFQGNGVLYYSNGKIFYSGCWKKNQFHGFGILNNVQSQSQYMNRNTAINYKNFNQNDNSLWTQYEGQFFEDKKHGFGTLYFTNGQKFSGCFVNDSIQGYGTFYPKGKSNISGVWKNNIFQS